MNKKIFSWTMYDWANSVFFTTVMAGFFPVFFKKYWNTETSVNLSTERLGWILALAGFILAIMSPLLGVISDYRRYKKLFLGFFMIVGAVATLGLFFVPQGDWFSAAVLYGIAFFSCSASCVFYDALLVSVCSENDYDMVSSLGYSFGYLGGGVLFLINVVMYLKPELFGISDAATAVRLSFVTVSIWWFVFSIPLFLNVDEPKAHLTQISLVKLCFKATRELHQTFSQIFQQKNIFYFVLAYWFYIDGVSTVMSMAVDYGISMGFEASDLIKALLLTQFIGFPAAYATGKLAQRWGNKTIIMICLAVYIVVVFGATKMTEPLHFYIMASLIGLAQGGVQALSRSLFASLIPADQSGEYFGFFNLLGKFASVIGPALMALSTRFFADPKQSILSLLLLFIGGFYFLLKVSPTKLSHS